MVLPGLTPEQVVDRAERCRTACAATGVPGPHGVVSRTVSVGIARLDRLVDKESDPTDGASALLQAADQALYAAKSDGRDRVAVA